jgi:uncharacterized protein YkwD
VRPTMPRRLSRLVAFVLASFVFTGVPAAADAASSCATAGSTPATMATAAIVTDTQCLLNRERAAHGLNALRLDARLAHTALRHSREMVAQQYFEHDSHSGRAFDGRIAATGWMHGRSGWSVGENIAWGSGSLSTPSEIMNAWMHSAGHRRNILHREFRVVGIGVERGAPVAGVSDGITYTTDFGS